jgi:phosphoribosyl 1,2-cyclic phosphodiesterase
MRVTLWGTRGSLPSPGPETTQYGGNTSCVEVCAADNSRLVLDAGTGIRRLGQAIADQVQRVDLLLTHLHMDHIQGLGFFEPLFRPATEVHIWGPSSTTLDLRTRLTRYLSPPLFPVRIRDLPRQPEFHDAASLGRFQIGPFAVQAELVCHPGPTVGYRIDADGVSVAYLPDHEPALGLDEFPGDPDFIPGLGLARDVDLLIHDAMYTAAEYPQHVGWGHSSLEQAIAFAGAAGAKRLVAFHHDPSHNDETLDRLFAEATASPLPCELVRGLEGASFEVSTSQRSGASRAHG